MQEVSAPVGVTDLLSTASTRMLLNGCSGDIINHRRGLRQDDPLSPMLFILVVDTLDWMFTKGEEAGLLQPLGHQSIHHRCSMYADDVILFASPTSQEFRVIVELLASFGRASGLQTNMEKCSITPIFADEALLPALQQVMPCQIAEFLVKYLGLPMSTKKIPKAHLHAIVDKVAARLPIWQGPLMPHSSRLVLIKAVLTSTPIYILMSEKLPPWQSTNGTPSANGSSGRDMRNKSKESAWLAGRKCAAQQSMEASGSLISSWQAMPYD